MYNNIWGIFYEGLSAKLKEQNCLLTLYLNGALFSSVK